jgi:flagellar hook-associated protein 3 FlgL
LFAGTNSSDAPFSSDPTGVGGVLDTSNATPPTVLVGDGVAIDMSVTGTEIRSTDSGDLFEILDNIEQALRTNDTDALTNLIPQADDAIEHVTDVTSRLGNNINRMEFMYERYESFRITQRSDISSLVDTDYAQAFSDLQRTQTAFDSAMAVHSTMFKNSLLDYL